MSDDEAKILAEAYARLERSILSTPPESPQARAVILRTLRTLQRLLHSDPAAAREILLASRNWRDVHQLAGK